MFAIFKNGRIFFLADDKNTTDRAYKKITAREEYASMTTVVSLGELQGKLIDEMERYAKHKGLIE